MSGKTTYEKILETAYDLFATLGYEQTSLSMISKKIDISKPALYYHFNSKEDLFEKLYGFIIDEMVMDYVIHDYPTDKASFIKRLVTKGYEDIKYVKERPDFPFILKQYLLLGIRNKKIQALTTKLNHTIYAYYFNLMTHAFKLSLINEQNIVVYTELLILLDYGILDKVDQLDTKALNQLWLTFINKLFDVNEINECSTL